MLFHYALVDDLITKEEFERRVEAKIDDCGDLIDEPTAAMVVVAEMGREHVKIRGLAARSSLFSFFGKVIDKTDPKVFERRDGEKGTVATLLLGDETGTVRVVLWDERAGAAGEVAAGDVLEVIGRHPGKNTGEIYALALRKATCQIECGVPPGSLVSLKTEPVNLDMRLLAKDPQRTYLRKDGTTGGLIGALAGDALGTARIVAWVPELLRDIPAGASVHITGAKLGTRGEGREYTLDERSTVTEIDTAIAVPFTEPGSVADSGTYSVQGIVKTAKEPRRFTTRDGKSSWVRNIVISDGNDELKVVLWGNNALLHLSKNSPVELYHGTAKPGRYGDIELHAGNGCYVRVPGEDARQVVFEGTVIPDPGGTYIDDGEQRYLLDNVSLPLWQEVRITGTVAGNRIHTEHWEPVPISIESVHQKIIEIKGMLGAP